MIKKNLVIFVSCAMLVIVIALAIIISLSNKTVYTVTFQYDDGTLIEKVTVNKGEAAKEPTVRPKDGEVFVEWDKDFTSVTSNMIVTAKMEKGLSDWEFSNSPNTYTVDVNGKLIRYIGSPNDDITAITFPNFDDDNYPVLAIGPNALGELSKNIVKVVIPNGIIRIEDGAFLGCKSLETVFIPDSVEYIGDEAFKDTDIETLTLGGGVKSIGGAIFGERTTAVNLMVKVSNPNIVIKNNNIVTADGRTLLCYSDFANSNPVIKAPVNKIAKKAFQGQKISSVTLPITLRTIEDRAFSQCNRLEKVNILSKQLTSIGDRAFEGTAITAFTFPDSLTQIDSFAFKDTKLVRAILPSSLTTLGSNLFYGVENISIYSRALKAKMPKDQTSWAGDNPVFYNYKGDENGLQLEIKYVYIDISGVEKLLHTETTEFGKSIAKTTYVPAPGEIDGRVFLDWSLTADGMDLSGVIEALTMPEKNVKLYAVTSGDNLFSFTSTYADGYLVSQGTDAHLYTHIDLPESYNGKKVYGIDSAVNNENNERFYYGFRGLTSLKSVTIPESYTVIGARAFSGCTALEEITLPDGVAVIKEETFLGCSSLKRFKLPSSCVEIGNKAFYQCTGLKEIDLMSVGKIGISAFEACGGIESLILPNSLTIIGTKAFYTSGTFKFVKIPASLISVGGYAFYGAGLTIDCTVFTKEEIIARGWIEEWCGNANVLYKPSGVKK